jgi:undecaprenyl-diphosphatase
MIQFFNTFSVLSEIILAILLGIVQGITEFLPISSTAHLLLFSKYLAGKDISLMASNIIQFGTFIAILQYFSIDIKLLLSHVLKRITTFSFKDFLQSVNRWVTGKQVNSKESSLDILVAQLFLATLPIIVVAIFLRKLSEQLRGDLRNIAYFLTIGGCIIIFAELVYLKRGGSFIKNETDKYNMSNFTILDTFIIGLFQSFAIFPGISRSGATLAGGLLTGKNRASAVRFSFLLSLPALALSSVKDIFDLLSDFKKGAIYLTPNTLSWNSSSIELSLISILLGTIVAYIVGILSLKWLLKYLSTNDSKIFIIYRILLVIFILSSVTFFK